ncbi:MAG: hypothetical protein OXT71_18980 [Acidobacteriota bacterium]|nr:hypothetical protein [Acidobacteriota bacterium]
MSIPSQDFAHLTAVEVYGAFLEECVIARVSNDRIGPPPKTSAKRIDGRPVRLVATSGKGGWSSDPVLEERWAENDNISLLDHLLSVARGALMFWLSDAPRPWSSESDLSQIEQLAHAVVCIAFLHDIDKDLELPRGGEITVADVADRMDRYGIDDFLLKREIRVSPAAMLNYIEEVEGTQAAGSAAAPDYDLRIAATCAYIELADKLEGKFTKRGPDGGVDGVVGSLRDANQWPVLKDRSLKKWEKVEFHDHLHVFLLDRFQRALSAKCREVTGRLPLIEIVHDGRFLCIIPQEQADRIKTQALDTFLEDLPYGLGFSVNNRLACEFVGGAANWDACRAVMQRTYDWRRFVNLFALPRQFAQAHSQEIDDLFHVAGMNTSWSPLNEGPSATVKPALEHPGGDFHRLDMEPAHALAFLTITLNHADFRGKKAAPDAETREQELRDLLAVKGRELPTVVAKAPAKDGRARRILLALSTIAEVWRLAEDDPIEAQRLLDCVVDRSGLIGLWLEGADGRIGLAEQIEDVSSDILDALCSRFSAYLTGIAAQPFDVGARNKHCILCNEPVETSRNVKTASRAHGIKASAFSGRDGRNDHLASPSGDTHLCPVCLAELQLRHKAQEEFKGSGDLPPLISSPMSTGLFAGLAFQQEDADVSMGLNDLNRLDVRKGVVYEGLDCQRKRIRLARLETLPNKDAELVAQLRMTLNAIQRVGRPVHIFRGSPHRHPSIFYSDALPSWLERMLGGDSIRIEQLPGALSSLKLFEYLANKPGLGIEWARQLADPDPNVRLGALCVAWGLAVDRRGVGDQDHAWFVIETETRERALALIRNIGGGPVNLKGSEDPLIRLAWLASRIQRRRSARDSTNKQLLCWKTALEFYPGADRSVSQDRTALILGLAGTLEEELARKKDAAAKKHRNDLPLSNACIEFATHFADEVWTKVFRSKEPTSQDQRRAAQIYRFALLETYRERGIHETGDDNPDRDKSRVLNGPTV